MHVSYVYGDELGRYAGRVKATAELEALRLRQPGYEAIRAVNPKIVYAQGTGFGTRGPWAERPA